MRKILSSFVAASLLAAPIAAHADTRPVPTSFAIMVNDDFVEEEPVGWLWTGLGILAGLGFVVLISDFGNSPT